MKNVTILFLFFYSIGFSQAVKPLKKIENSSTIDLKGNKNIITVIQGDDVIVYNLKDENDSQKLLEYLQNIPTLNVGIKKILNYNKQILTLVTQMFKNGIFDQKQFIEKLEEYVRENERLKMEIENLKKETQDVDFATILDSATKKLERYDNDGYQQILENYKIAKRINLKKLQKEIGSADYFQALNNYYNYNLVEALAQVSEAVEYDEENVQYLFLKTSILYSLYQFDDCINIYLKLLNLTKDTLLQSTYYNNLGLAYDGKNDFNNALKYYSKALKLQKNPSDRGTLYNNIGFIYFENGDYDKALDYYNEALLIKEKIYGQDHPEIAALYNNFGLVYYNKGEYPKALEYFNTALLIKEKIFGKEHPETANTYGNIGLVYEDMSDNEKALEFYSKDLEISEKVFGKQHPKTATAYTNISGIYSKKRDYDKALKYYNLALEIREKTFGKEHPETAIVYNNIGGVYNEKGDYDKALEYYNKAFEVRNKVFGAEHPSTANIDNNIGAVFFAKGDYIKSLDFYETALKIRQKVFGEENNFTQISFLNCFLLSVINGEKVKSSSYLEKIKFSKYQVAIQLNIKALVLFKIKEYPVIINIYNLALDFLKKNNTSEKDILSIIIYRNLAAAYCYNGNKDKAAQTFEKVLILVKDIKSSQIDVEQIKKNYEECKSK